MDLSIIILNWNAAADTLACVDRLTAWSRLHPTIWVVDNASLDGSADIIVRARPQVRLIRNQANLGFAGGNNRGLAEALTAGNAPILLLNNDAWIEEADVIRLVETLQADPQLGFVGPFLYDADDREHLLSAGGRNPVLSHHSRLAAPPTSAPVYPVDYVPGAILLARAETLRRVGLLHEAYFFNMEVAELCLRAARHGYRSGIDARARGYHAVSRSSGLRDSLYVYYIIRNRFLLLRQHHRWQIWLYGFWIAYSLALALNLWLKGKRRTAQSVWLGLQDGLAGRFGGQNERVLAAVNHL